MRRFTIAALVALETLVASSILACSLQLSQEIRKSDSIRTVAHAVVSTTRHLADGVRISIRYRA